MKDHAGKGRCTDAGIGASHRPLPVVPQLQDGVPLQRQLPAAGGPGPRRDRDPLHARSRRSAAARRCWCGCCRYPGRFRRSIGLCLARPAAAADPRSGCRASATRLEAMLRLAPARLPARVATQGQYKAKARGREASPRRAADRLRPGRAGAADQRRDDPRARIARGSTSCCPRTRAAPARSLITWATSHAGAGARPAPISTPGHARSRAKAWRPSSSPPRGLRRDDQGLRRHVRRAIFPIFSKSAAGGGARQGRQRVSRPASTSRSPNAPGGTVAYHPACTLQHGQKILDAPKTLLKRAGYEVRVPAEAHLCCGSAGVEQRAATAHRRRAARPQAAQPRSAQGGRDRHRKHRLHDADRLGVGDAGGAYGPAARLGAGRPGAGARLTGVCVRAATLALPSS